MKVEKFKLHTSEVADDYDLCITMHVVASSGTTLLGNDNGAVCACNCHCKGKGQVEHGWSRDGGPMK